MATYQQQERDGSISHWVRIEYWDGEVYTSDLVWVDEHDWWRIRAGADACLYGKQVRPC